MNKNSFFCKIIVMMLILSSAVSITQSDSLAEGGEVLWHYDADLFVRNIGVTHLNGDGIKDVIAAEYDSDSYDAVSKVYGIDGSSGSTIWTYTLNDGVRSLAIADVNDDGTADAIAGASHGSSTPDGRVHAIDGTDGSSIWTYTPSNSGGDTIGDLAIGDFNGDQYPDVAVACWDDYVYAINGQDGTELWNKYIGSIFVQSVDTGDVNGDGYDDVSFAHDYLTGYDNYLGVLYGNNGSFIWNVTVTYTGQETLVADIDNDGDLEAVYGIEKDNDDTAIQVRDGLTGTIEWSYTLGNEPDISTDVFLFANDIDSDGDLDLLVGNEYVDFYIRAFDGDSSTPMWTSEELNGYPRHMSFGDVNNNGYKNIVAATYDRVQILNATDGTLNWYYSVAGTIRGTCVGDFNDDGVLDVACSGGAEYSGDDPGKAVWTLKTISDSPVLWEYNVEEYGNAIALGDLTGDSADDVVAVTSEDKAWAIDGVTGNKIWEWLASDNLYTATCGDFDGDGDVDAAVAGNAGIVTALESSSGTQLWQFSTPTDTIGRKCLKSYDMNNDGMDDVITGSDDSNVYVIDGSTANELWSLNVGGRVEEVELAQMNTDNVMDIVVAATNQVTVVDGATEQIMWSYTSIDNAKHVEAVDMNNDGTKDVVTANLDQVMVINGSSQSLMWSASKDINSDYSVAAGLLNGDNVPDVVVGGNYNDESVECFDGIDGSSMWVFNPGDEVNCVLTKDVDDNGNLEVVVGSDDQHVYVLGGSNGVELWSHSTADAVMHIQMGDLTGDNKPNLAAITFGFDGVVYAFSYIEIPLEAEAGGPYEAMENVDINFYGMQTGGMPPFSYHWDFGDGSTSNQQNPTHAYSTAGSYTAILTVTDANSDQSTDDADVSIYSELIADANGPYQENAESELQFTGIATGGKEPYTWHWDFGDGSTSNLQNPTHTYQAAGQYTVELTVSDDYSPQNTDNDTTTASINPKPLKAIINGPYEGIEQNPIQFTGGADGGVQPYNYSWDFGDGSTSYDKDPIHTYEDPGEYEVILLVTDSQEEQATNSTSASVYSASEVIADAGGPYTGVEGQSIQMNGDANGGDTPYEFLWDFGDGSTSTEKNPVHTYEETGEYSILLTVTDNQGISDEDTTSAIVYPSGTLLADANGPYEAFEFEEITFSGSATGGVTPYTFRWDFGDGVTSSEQNPVHAYSSPGSYTATFTVTDAEENTDSDTTTVYIKKDNSNPTVSILNPTKGIYVDNTRLLPFITTIAFGQIDIEIESSDLESGIKNVVILIDSEEQYSSTETSFTWTWSEKAFGRKIVEIIAYDQADNAQSVKMPIWKIM